MRGAREREEMVELRRSGMSLAEIGRRYRLTRQGVAYIIDKAGRVPAGQVVQARRDRQFGEAYRRVDEVLACYRAGDTIKGIALRVGVTQRVVRATIAESATARDRAVRVQAARVVAQPPQYSERELIDALRRVARRLGAVPSEPEYARLARELGLPGMTTVYMRFGGWRRALAAAGLQTPPAPARVYGARWHLVACWRALESVADQLGDPPRYRRYVELYEQRDDLPSPATLRARLGLWSEIAAALLAHRGSVELSGEVAA